MSFSRKSFSVLLICLFVITTLGGSQSAGHNANRTTHIQNKLPSLNEDKYHAKNTNPNVLDIAQMTQDQWDDVRDDLLNTGISAYELAMISDEQLLLIHQTLQDGSTYVPTVLIESSSNPDPNRTDRSESRTDYADSVSTYEEEQANSFLAETDMPRDIIDTLSPTLKVLIASTLEPGSEYVPAKLIESNVYDPAGAFTSKEILTNEWDSTFNIENMGISSEHIPQADITPSEMSILVSTFKSPGKEQLSIYPSYEWLVPRRPRGKDYFGYSTSDSYSVVPGVRSNAIWSRYLKSDPWAWPGAMDYSSASLTGYQHQGKSLGTPDSNIYLRGNAYFMVDIDKANPVKKIAIGYVHDWSRGSAFSYGVSFKFASISFTPYSGDVAAMSNVYYLVY